MWRPANLVGHARNGGSSLNYTCGLIWKITPWLVTSLITTDLPTLHCLNATTILPLP